MRKYDNFVSALENLKEGAKLKPPYSVVEQTGIIGLFEICFRQSWTLMQEVLEYNGRAENKIDSPRGVLKTAFLWGMINDEEKWLSLLDTRDTLAHTYSNEDSLKAIGNIKEIYLGLFEELKRCIDEEWEMGE
ncbi:MAG: HI0074 family nucleotidyltransferase substrate-binding subunit [Ruminococcus sp.]|nr:HI0074 family nucleotidyltransferase substrate-binding subunit [Ruminococcus sp.]